TASLLLYTYILPPGVNVRQGQDGYDLTVENIPEVPNEDYLPPFGSLTYRLVFYYSPFRTSAEYWKTEGKYWSKDFDRFANPSGKIRDAVNGMVAPGDNDEQKAKKIYAAVMKLENTSFTREHSSEENKAEGLKVKNAEDIWAQQRGDDDEITRLFVAMARAAGLKADGAAVANRDDSVFLQSFLSWNQLDDELAIVSIGGKEVYLDPGQRYCEFGQLHWKHTFAGGVRQKDNGTELFTTPGPTYKDNSVDRVALLTLTSGGQVDGLIHETMTGSEALRWRQAALLGDETAVKKEFEEDLQRSMPPGVQVKTNHFVGLTDISTPLMAIVNVSGTLGTQTGKRVFMPAVFFEGGNAPLFAKTQRDDPVDLHYPYMVHDDFRLTLPANMTIANLPPGGDVQFIPFGDYLVKFVSQGNVIAYGRLFRLGNAFYKASEYPALRDFYQKMSAKDQQQVVLQLSPIPAATTTATAAGKGQ
ncbi:MAG: transglutaminase-like domain-containing protein, partial [Silvibacterium sp.]